MASLLVVTSSPLSRRGLLLSRWAPLSLLLAAELVVLTIRFDAEMVWHQPALWARLVIWCHHLSYLAVAILSALVLFAGPHLWRELRDNATASQQHSRTWLFLLSHLAFFGLFVRLTSFLLESAPSLLTAPGWWAMAWFASGSSAVLMWGLSALPAGVWLRLLQHSLVPFTMGTAIGSAAWMAAQGAEHLGGILDGITFQLVHFLLTLFCPDAYCRPGENLLGTSTFYVYIAPQCAGYQGIGLIGVFSILYLWVFRRSLRFPRALLLLPLGILVVYLANAVRIIALIAVGTYLSPQVALGGFHSQAGWLAFNGVALSVVYGTRRLGWFARTEAAADQPDSTNVTAAYVVPLLGLVAATMVSTAFSTGFDWLYPLRVLVVGALLWHFRAAYRQLSWRCSWIAVALGLLAFVLWLVLESVTVDRSAGESLAEGLRGLPKGWAMFWLVFRVVGSVVTVPLAEELAFRIYLLRRCQSRDLERIPFQRFTWLSFLLSSLLFGLLHGRWLAGMLAGMVYALALYRRGKPADAVLSHGVTNGLIAAYVLATGSWGLWL